ncbi:diguanylate cyclase [Neptuniibacter sp. CAU 1671]|uniref:diguanylate cyclase domain-containing protein n=1 Tax=Neptuniibacter sp. CAU 1671 TaxID=3032593 RepID=UPI0023DB7956|nr:diguanylate cyclase [Neptuniibacter sp. CAU 1671]MDF2181003.1 diguanylate cyclase [Neptuniibacter sp. CAU 1671]
MASGSKALDETERDTADSGDWLTDIIWPLESDALLDSLKFSPLPLVVTDEKLMVCYANSAATPLLVMMRGDRPSASLSLAKAIASPFGNFIRWLQGETTSGLEVRLFISSPSDYVAHKRVFERGDRTYYAISFCPRDNLFFLSQELNIYQAVFQYARQAIVITDDSGRVITVNPAFCELSGYASREVVWRSVQALFEEGDSFVSSIEDTLEDAPFWEGRAELLDASGALINTQLKVVDTRAGYLTEHEVIRVYILENIEDQLERERALQRSAETDSLTGLFNRAGFNRVFSDCFQAAQRTGEELTLLFIDLDNFKQLNDNHGHAKGDELLLHIGKRLRHNLKQGDFLARIGGDEFVVLLKGSLPVSARSTVANKLIQTLCAPYSLNDLTYTSSVSIGVASYPDDAISAEALIKAADEAMYQAKYAGRNRFWVYSNGLATTDNRLSATPCVSGSSEIATVSALLFDPLTISGSAEIGAAWVSVRLDQIENGKRYPLPSMLPDRRQAETLEQTITTLSLTYDFINGLDQTQPRVPLIVPVSAENLIAPELIYLLKRRQEAYPEVAPLIYLALSAEEIGQIDHQLLEQLRYLKGLGYGLALTKLGRDLQALDLLRRVSVDLVSFDAGILPGTLESETLSAYWFRAILAMLKELQVPVLLPAALQAEATTVGNRCWAYPDSQKLLEQSVFRARLTKQAASNNAAE